jgi:hypothetical protein
MECAPREGDIGDVIHVAADPAYVCPGRSHHERTANELLY